MNPLFTQLRQQLAGGIIPAAKPVPTTSPTGLNGIPLVSQITVATFNFFDNGEDHKVKWSSARYSMNVQLFTQTQQFTPSLGLVAWYSTIQLHDADFWIRYVEHKAGTKKIDEDTFARLKEVYRKTCTDYPKGALIGTVVDKHCGTNYAWPYFLLFWIDEFEEANLEVHLDDMLPVIDAWETVKQVPGKSFPILRARYNPLGLWKRSTPKWRKQP
jgi:hypothetical protein